MSDSSEKSVSKRRARGLQRAFDILGFLHACKGAKRPIDIAVGMNAPKSSVYELTGMLIELGILERVDSQGRVFLGRKLHYWGLSYLENFDLTRYAQPILEQLTELTRETSQLCMLDGDKYAVVMMNEGSRQFRISADVGEKMPIPWTASGRLLLGHLSDEEICEFVPEEDFVLPDGSRIENSEFISSIRAAGKDGFFSFDSLSDTYTHCFAAPVYDTSEICTATLCLIAPKEDANSNYTKYRAVLLDAARKLTKNIRGEVQTFTAAAE